MKKEFEYKTCDKCCYDILDNDGDVMEHECLDPTPQEWEELKKNLPKFIKEGVQFALIMGIILMFCAFVIIQIINLLHYIL
tara:strand:+ start:365 stop:607 length:243 start_codon:yes stop_codon:yes gene_type:complete